MSRQLLSNSINRLVIGSTAKVFGIKILSTILSLLTQVALARILGVSEYGRYVFCLSVFMFFVFLARVGFDISGLKFIPQYKALGDSARLLGFIRFSRNFVALASLISLVLVSVFSHLIPSGEMQYIWLIVFASALLIPVDAIAQLATTELRGLGAVVLANSYDAIVRPLILLITFFLLLHLAGLQATALLALQAYTIGSCFTLILSTVSRDLIIDSNQPSSTTAVSSIDSLEWIKVSTTLWLLNLFEVLLALADVYYVGLLLGTEAAGLFGAASRLALLLIFGMVAVNATVAPLLAAAFARKDKLELERLARIASCISFFFALPVAVVFIPFGGFFLGLFGAEFRSAHLACAILICGQVCVSAAAPAYYLVTLCHQQCSGAIVFAGAFILNAALNFTLIPLLGLNGAAVASALSASSAYLGLYLIARYKLGIVWGAWQFRELLLPLKKKA